MMSLIIALVGCVVVGAGLWAALSSRGYWKAQKELAEEMIDFCNKRISQLVESGNAAIAERDAARDLARHVNSERSGWLRELAKVEAEHKRDYGELQWWRVQFATRVGGSLPKPHTALTGRHYTIVEVKPRGSRRKRTTLRNITRAGQ